MNLLELAITVALDVHRGQHDRYGHPYILHPLHVMLQMDTEEEMVAAALHDVVEDSEMTLDDLRAQGFPERIVEVVSLLTHDKDAMSYDDYVRRLKPNPIARKIKLADLQHNMDIRRLKEVGPKDATRLEKYHRAWRMLTADSREQSN